VGRYLLNSRRYSTLLRLYILPVLLIRLPFDNDVSTEILLMRCGWKRNWEFTCSVASFNCETTELIWLNLVFCDLQQKLCDESHAILHCSRHCLDNWYSRNSHRNTWPANPWDRNSRVCINNLSREKLIDECSWQAVVKIGFICRSRKMSVAQAVQRWIMGLLMKSEWGRCGLI
jgi:hypothetical protein